MLGLAPEQALQAWERAVQNAAGHRITARFVRSAARQLNLICAPNRDKASPRSKKADQRQQVLTAIAELMILLHQRADYPTLLEKAEVLYGHIQAALTVTKRKKPGLIEI